MKPSQISTQTTVVEVVQYRVKADQVEATDLIVRLVNERASQFPGFVSRQVHQSSEEPTIYLDYVQWESLELAQAAAQQMPQIPELAPFMEAIEEVQSFHHFVLKH